VQAETRHGGGTKGTKLTKITKKTYSVFFVVFVAFVIFVPPPFAKATEGRPPWRVSPQAQQTPPPPPQPGPPVFRAGAHYVRVDAYPTGKDGRMIEGLTKDDFEIYEDGKLQTIEHSEYITFDTWTPDGERKDPRTQQDAYDLAADPTWRVFVIVIDRGAYDMAGQHHMRGPLHQFIDRNLGPRDLFGLLTTQNSAADLVLGQQTTVVNALLDRPEWRAPQNQNPAWFDDRYLVYHECGLSSLIPRRMLDDTYLLLEGLVRMLGLIRQEKKSIVFVANGLASPGPMRGDGPMGLGLPDMPKIGITNGRVGEIPRPGDRIGVANRSSMCAGERMKLVSMDFQKRFRDLLRAARQANVAFYPISPAGLQVTPLTPFSSQSGFEMAAFQTRNYHTDTLRTLASETDGLAIVNTNDLAGGMRRIANDVAAYYVLGYYTTNTTWDGKPRSIKVRLKPKGPSTRLGTGSTIRARRQYLAPTQVEIASLSPAAAAAKSSGPSPVDVALRALDPSGARPDPPMTPPPLLGLPRAYRVLPRAREPVAVLHFSRADRMRIEWTVSAALDRRTIRVLDRTGKPLPVEVPLMDKTESEGERVLAVELPLGSFAGADYVLDLQAASASIVERSLLAFRVR
jgi:VWFA-related protein